jgi:hypothetical protein
MKGLKLSGWLEQRRLLPELKCSALPIIDDFTGPFTVSLLSFNCPNWPSSLLRVGGCGISFDRTRIFRPADSGRRLRLLRWHG